MGFVGLQVDYYYSLTYRQFTNTVNGYRKREDNKSREQWLMTRKMMYAAIAPHSSEGLKETDLMEFPWESKVIKEMSALEEMHLLEGQEQARKFFEKFDKKS